MQLEVLKICIPYGTEVTSGQAYKFTVKAGEVTYLRIIVQNGTAVPNIRIVSFQE